MKTDISIHFTTKGQSIESIYRKLKDYLEKSKIIPFDFSKTTESSIVVHHCFLPERIKIEKGFSLDIYDRIINPISEYNVCWCGVTNRGLDIERRLMLRNLKKLNGLAIFIGHINDKVQEEWEIAIELGIEYIMIP